MKYELALQYATEVKEILKPYCERIEIAGGVRRKKAEPHDIEIVAKPKPYESRVCELGRPVFLNALDSKIYELLSSPDFSNGDPDKAGKKAPCGPKYYRLKYKNEKLDIFAVIEPAQWGTVFLIRTGDADFSHEFVTRLWKYGLQSKDGHIESKEANSNPHGFTDSLDRPCGLVYSTPEELDAFKLCQMPFIEPEKRTIKAFKELKE